MPLGIYFVSFKFVVSLFHASSWESALAFRHLRASPVACSVAQNLISVHCCQTESPGEGFGSSRKGELNCSAGQRGALCPNLRGFLEFSSSRVELLIRCLQGLHSFNLVSGNLLVSFYGSLKLKASAGLLWNEEC